MVAFNEMDQFGDVATWDLICSGNTKGVFQLESKLGASWAKRVKPRNIEELSDLIAIIRPGCLDTILDGKSMTKHYVDRKHGKEPASYVHECLEPILKETYGVLVYQEQAIRISMDIAGFTPEEGDSLRKAVGKKDAALMNIVKTQFIEGCIQRHKLNLEQSEETFLHVVKSYEDNINGSKKKKTIAEEIFSQIEASARYSFNKSHSVCYAINSFRSAFCKTHYMLSFYKTYLNHAHNKPDKQDEIRELITDAKQNGIEVYPPTLDHFYRAFTKDKAKNIIYFGYSNVKNVGEREQIKINESVERAECKLEKAFSEFTWLDLLFHFSVMIKKTAFVSLVSVGALNGKNNQKTRNSMLFEYKTFIELKDKEIEWIINQKKEYPTLADAIKDLLNNNSDMRTIRLKTVHDLYNSLINPPHSLNDSIEWKADIENKLMGCSLSCVKSDSVSAQDADCTCRDLTSRNAQMGHATVVVQVKRCNEYKIKNGERVGELMAFLTVEDFTGSCDSFVVFSEAYAKYKKLLFVGNLVVLSGIIKLKDKDLSFIVNEVKQI